MNIAILAGGLGTRLGPMTQAIPKALIDINGEPFIAHQLRLLRSRGIQRAVLCLGYLGEMIQDFVQDGRQFGLSVSYSFDGAKLLGTAGAIHQALALLGDEFFVVYGDSYLPCDYGAVYSAFQKSGKQGLMTVFQNDGEWDASNVEYGDKGIVAYDKRHRTPRMRYIDYGLGAFRREAFLNIDSGAAYDLAQLYQDLLARGELDGFEVSERFYEVGSPAGIREISALLSAGSIKAT